MRTWALVAIGGALGFSYFVGVMRRAREAEFLKGEPETGGDFMQKLGVVSLDKALDFINVANMARVDKALVNHPNVKAFLRVIRQGESSQADLGYRMIVGGQTFNSFADHPRIKGKCWTTAKGTRLCSTAAGAYQITQTSWDETRAKMGLPDFTPKNQDLAALGRIAYRGALPAVIAGDLATAIKKLRLEWTSLPGAAENNTAAGGLDKSKQVFLAYGGQLLGGAVMA